MSPQAVLKIHDLTLSVHIGFTPEERSKKQEVRVSFQIESDHLPDACLTDELSKTVSYETLIGSINRLVQSKTEFKTVEKLAFACFENLKEQLPSTSQLSLSVHKVNPPIDGLKGGVHFQLSDKGSRS
jgi:FolB domain-containing protein